MNQGLEVNGTAGRISCRSLALPLHSKESLCADAPLINSKLPSAKGQPATHTLDFTPMSAVFMERMLARIREDCGEALRIFGTGTHAGLAADGGAGASVVKRFVDRLVGEVVGLHKE
jgi:hypothetical protein